MISRHKIFIIEFTSESDSDSIFITTKKFLNKDVNIFENLDPANLFYDTYKKMSSNKIIAACNFSYKKHKKYTYYFPFSTIVSPRYRRKGFGSLLYKTILFSIHKQNIELDKILFAQHCVIEPFTTSNSAEFIYDSLIKDSYLKLNNIACLHKYYFLYQNINPRIFKINKIPEFKDKLILSTNKFNIFRIYN